MASKPAPGLTLKIERVPHGWRATVTLGLLGGAAAVSTMGIDDRETNRHYEPSPAAALHRAVVAANQVLQSPQVLALLPPQVTTALAVTRDLARIAKRGLLDRSINGRKLWEGFHGAFRQLARGLSDVATGKGGGAVMGGERLQLVDHTGCIVGALPDAFRRRHQQAVQANRPIIGPQGRGVRSPGRLPIGPQGGVMPGLGPIPGFPPPSPAQNPYATDPWAPFAQPNQQQTPAFNATPSEQPTPAYAPSYPGEPPAPMSDEEFERVFGMPEDA